MFTLRCSSTVTTKSFDTAAWTEWMWARRISPALWTTRICSSVTKIVVLLSDLEAKTVELSAICSVSCASKAISYVWIPFFYVYCRLITVKGMFIPLITTFSPSTPLSQFMLEIIVYSGSTILSSSLNEYKLSSPYIVESLSDLIRCI